jgi:hypothetical protein
LIRLFEKEIAGEADADVFAAFDPVAAVASALQRIVEVVGFVDLGTILIPLFIQKIHIAVLTAFADLFAAMPWIPDIVHCGRKRLGMKGLEIKRVNDIKGMIMRRRHA